MCILTVVSFHSTVSPPDLPAGRIRYGYSKDDNGEIVIDEAQAEVVRMIFQMYREGAGVQRIKDSLEGRGIQAPSGGRSWPKRTIEKILTNEKYSGISDLRMEMKRKVKTINA